MICEGILPSALVFFALSKRLSLRRSVQSRECPCTDDRVLIDSKIKAMTSGWVEVVEVIGIKVTLHLIGL
jgi:hypothetical protein